MRHDILDQEEKTLEAMGAWNNDDTIVVVASGVRESTGSTFTRVISTCKEQYMEDAAPLVEEAMLMGQSGFDDLRVSVFNEQQYQYLIGRGAFE